MQNILDRTEESLAEAFAYLATHARRQQRLYFATIAVLMTIVAFSTVLLVLFAIDRQLDLQRTVSTQNASQISLLAHRDLSLLIRTELTVQFYQRTADVHRAPDDMTERVRSTGVAVGRASLPDTRFDLLVAPATSAAWGDELAAKLWRLAEAADATLATRYAFELPYRVLLLGLDADYAAILPALDAAREPHAPPVTPPLAAVLRNTIVDALAAQTGKRTLANGERVLVGPYRDPLLGTPAMAALSVYNSGGKPSILIVLTIPGDTLLAHLREPSNSVTLLLASAQQVPLVSTPRPEPATVQMLRDASAQMPDDSVRYTRDGAIFVDALRPGDSRLVSYITWGALIAALAWQLAAVIGLGLLLLAAVALTAKFWGMRLLRDWHDEATRALQNETINHIVVRATPIGLCIVRQRDFSIVTSNRRARALLHLDDATSLPPHVATQMARSMRARAEARRSMRDVAEFLVPAVPDSLPDRGADQGVDQAAGQAANHRTIQRTNHRDASHAPMLQINYAEASHLNEQVLICAILDVTARYALSRQLRAATRETEAIMRAQSSFFAAMSHEIRTPMNALLGNLELLSQSPGLEPHQQRLRALAMAADGLRRIVSDILDLSKIDAGKMQLVSEPFVPLDDLEQLALSYAPLVGERPLRFHAYLSPTLDTALLGDRTRVVQIVNNLLSNAFKFTSSGKITLHARVEIDAQRHGVLQCRVSDSGIGIGAAQLATLFEPFMQAQPQTSQRFGGTGLGLSICARLAELMGGKVVGESVVGVGSAFTVTLPLDAAPAEAGGGAAEADHGAPSEAAAPARGNLFVLCEESAFADWLDEVFTSRGWLVTCAASLDAAQAWLRINRPEAMVVGEEQGSEALATLRAMRPVKVVRAMRMGPHQPALHRDGVIEVTEFSQGALALAIELAVSDAASCEASKQASREPPRHPMPRAVPPPAAGPAPALAPVDASHGALNGLRVLVAEDNPLNQALITEQLTALGCAPIVIGDGKQALAVLAQSAVDLLMTDIHMPVMDGCALLTAVRAAGLTLPVVAFTAVTGAADAGEWRQRGFAGCIAKPASLAQLDAGLREARAQIPATPAATERTTRDDTATTAQTAADAEPGRKPEPEPEAGPNDPFSTLDHARYMAMLKEHLRSDLPRLAALVCARDRDGLRDWAHSAGGAFLIVREPRFAAQCRELQRLCDASGTWSAALAQRAQALHDALRSRFGLDESTLH
jgi:two-component system capsular synthesis sensor histidine kinase RcsC